MMPDLAVMPQPMKVQAAKSSLPGQSAKAAMQRAASQSDTPAQAAPTTATSAAKPAAEKSKSADQPAPFLALLMAQLAMPTEQAIPQVANVSQTPVQTTTQVIPAGNQVQAISTLETAPVASAAATHNTQTVVQPIVTTTPVGTSAASGTTPAAQTTVTTPTVEPVVAPLEAQTVQTPQVVATAAKPVVEKADAGGGSSEKGKTNPIPAAAQTPATPSLKGDKAPATESTQTQTDTTDQPVTVVTTATPKIPTPAIPNKPALAEALSDHMTARWEPKQTPSAAKQTQPSEALPATKVANANSQAMFHNPNIMATSAVQGATDTIALPQTSTPTTTTTTLADSAASLKPLTTQVVDGMRSVAASGAGSDKTLVLNLNPPELGRVMVKMQEEGGSITAVLRVENPATRADIEQSVPSIVRSLEQAGIQVRRLEVLSSDPIPQDGSSNRQFDFQGGMLNQQRDSQQTAQSGQTGQTGAARTEAWQDSQQPALAASQQSVVTDSGLNIYM